MEINVCSARGKAAEVYVWSFEGDGHRPRPSKTHEMNWHSKAQSIGSAGSHEVHPRLKRITKDKPTIYDKGESALQTQE